MKAYEIKHKSVMGQKSKTVVLAPDKKTAENYAKAMHPQSGSKISVKRYTRKDLSGHLIRRDPPYPYTNNAGGEAHESTESMAHSSEEKTLGQTFTTGVQDHEDD